MYMYTLRKNQKYENIWLYNKTSCINQVSITKTYSRKTVLKGYDAEQEIITNLL